MPGFAICIAAVTFLYCFVKWQDRFDCCQTGVFYQLHVSHSSELSVIQIREAKVIHCPVLIKLHLFCCMCVFTGNF